MTVPSGHLGGHLLRRHYLPLPIQTNSNENNHHPEARRERDDSRREQTYPSQSRDLLYKFWNKMFGMFHRT